MKKILQFVLVLSLFAICLAQSTQINLATQVTGVLPTANGGIPSGMILFISSGSCPSGFTEQTFAGDYLLMTQAASGDVGTSGGSTSYTPHGTNATASLSVTGTKLTTSSSGTAAATSIGGITVSTSAQNATVPAETFTGTAATIQPTYEKLIACKKN